MYMYIGRMASSLLISNVVYNAHAVYAYCIILRLGDMFTGTVSVR